MAYEYVFDAQPTVNGTNIKDILINGKYPDEVYCNGSHIAHLKKDVTVGIYHLCLFYQGDLQKVTVEECDRSYTYYYATFEAYSYIEIDQSKTISEGKRIKKIYWWGKTEPFQTKTQQGTVTDVPLKGNIATLLGSALAEIWYNSSYRDYPTGKTPYTDGTRLFYRTENKCTITFTDGTEQTVGWKDNYGHSVWISPSFWTAVNNVIYTDFQGDTKSETTYSC